MNAKQGGKKYENCCYDKAFDWVEDEDGNIHYSGDKLEPYRQHINNDMFWGFDFDTTMLRVSAMNMMLHGVSSANIHYQDSLNKSIKDNYPDYEEDARRSDYQPGDEQLGVVAGKGRKDTKDARVGQGNRGRFGRADLVGYYAGILPEERLQPHG